MKNSLFLIITILFFFGSHASAQKSDERLNKFIILGTLRDYLGRELDPRHESLLDRFEGSMLLVVDSLIKVTYPTKVYQEIKKTGTIISSNFLASQFNAFYNFKPSRRYTSPGGKEILTGTLKDNIFHNRREKMAFLAGVFLRFGHQTDSVYLISIANSASKAKMCYALLKEFNCKPNYIIRTNYIPNGHHVFFHPTSKVLAYLKRYEPINQLSEESQKFNIQHILNENMQKPLGSNK